MLPSAFYKLSRGNWTWSSRLRLSYQFTTHQHLKAPGHGPVAWVRPVNLLWIILKAPGHSLVT